ncbi:transglycosylase domain-containing protein [uncultured Clostridium sp.]|uniref:transglycosylase domain-containing protein n=1 Tax=uncultured Clostridium sp. TaxID=59620 RepID=UPI0025DE8454|nr:PBP1A family penicillin-binding protein [uncultured Clostridium sp.]
MAVNNSTKTKSSPRNKKKSRQNNGIKLFKGICFGLIFCFLALFVMAAGYAFAIIKTTPPLNVDDVLSLNQPSSLFDNDGNFMDNLHTDEERYVIDSSEMPANLKNAFVSIEDERFYKHNGIDVQRIAGAALLDIKKILTGQRGLHGASTLTQQLLKNTILTNDVSIERKVKEIYLAINLEKKLTKDQILTAYLNTIPLGGQVYGVEAASLLYFSKNTSDLSLIECAYLAGITQAPTTYSAYNENNIKDPSPYINRTITVLSMMKQNNYITEAECSKAIEDVKNGGLVFKKSKQDYNLNYEWFVYPTVSQVKEDLKKKYNYTDEEVSKLVVNGGLKIYTTMDKELQDFTQQTLDNYKNLGISNAETYDSNGVPLLQASATIVDYRNSKVLAMVGGRGRQQPQSTNRAYNALRPIGSTTKPLTVYGPAINEKVITAATPIDDAPLPANKLNGGNHYDPANSDFTYQGLMTAREALTYSKNTAAVIVEDMLGIKTGIEYGEKLGLKYNSKSKSSIASLALGQFNNDPKDPDGGNTYILAGAFGTFGNEGEYVRPILYTKVVDATGKTILDNEHLSREDVFSPETAYIMYDMLKGPVTYYSSTPAKWGEMPVSGKTGTTSDSCDLWFAGLTPYLSGSVWLGYDNPTKLSGGSSACAKLWGMIMAKAHEGLKVKEIEEPSSIVKVSVCRDSGLLPSSLCSADQRGSRVYEELFAEGTEPTETCNVHVVANINRLNNKLATPGTPSFLVRKEIYIRKDNPNPATADYNMVLPSSYDPTTSSSNYGSGQSDTENSTDNTQNAPDNNTNQNDTQNNNTQTGPVTDPSQQTQADVLPPPVTDNNPIITPIN